MKFDPYQIVLAPRITEKTTRDADPDGNNAYAFKVNKKANKIEIRKAVEALFNVEVAHVRTANRRGKTRRLRNGKLVKKQDWKKAVVKLKDGFTIDVM